MLFCLCNLSINNPAYAYGNKWTEKKLGKIIVKADRASRKKQWDRAVSYGEKVLEGSLALDQKSDQRYINLLKNLNVYYDHSNRPNRDPSRIKEAYILSKMHLGPTHKTTFTSRNLLYKKYISQKKYREAIPLARENIQYNPKRTDSEFREYYYLTQLYSLYGLTEQFDKEEDTLKHMIDIARDIFGEEDEEYKKTILNLAKNYCRQKKYTPFTKLTKEHNLKYICN